jgi:hypothetical protein
MKDDHTKSANIVSDICKGDEYATALAVKTEQAAAAVACVSFAATAGTHSRAFPARPRRQREPGVISQTSKSDLDLRRRST